MAWTVASCTPCDRSSTSSLLGRRAAAVRRRSWTSSSSGTWTWNGRVAVRSPSGAERGVGTAPTVLDAVGWVGAGIGHLLAVVSNSAEREDVGPGAGLAERDLHRPFADRAGLADELVQAAVAEQAAPLLVDVHAGGRTRRLPAEEHEEGAAAPPSRRAREGIGSPVPADSTRWASRAEKRKAMLPPARPSTASS